MAASVGILNVCGCGCMQWHMMVSWGWGGGGGGGDVHNFWRNSHHHAGETNLFCQCCTLSDALPAE